MSTGPDDEDERESEAVQPIDETLDGVEEDSDSAVDDGDEEWRFSVDDFPDDEQEESNVAGSLESRQPLEPGDIDLENAFFVALGVFIVLGLVVGALLGF